MTQTGLERRAEFTQGYLSRLIYRPEGNSAIDPFKLEKLSDILRVEYHWLATGRQPMRAATFARTPREAAIVDARELQPREGAIEEAIEHVLANFPDDPERTQRYWFDLILLENDSRRRDEIPERLAKEHQSEHRAQTREKRRIESPSDTKPPPAVKKRRAG